MHERSFSSVYLCVDCVSSVLNTFLSDGLVPREMSVERKEGMTARGFDR